MVNKILPQRYENSPYLPLHFRYLIPRKNLLNEGELPMAVRLMKKMDYLQ